MGIKIIAATRIIRNILFLISSSILLTYLYFSVDLLTFIFQLRLVLRYSFHYMMFLIYISMLS
jgi:hypothetical protein